MAFVLISTGIQIILSKYLSFGQIYTGMCPLLYLLMISGHTHNGQIVPFNLVVSRFFKRTVGLFRAGLTHLYVSPGTGTWGPVMRLGSRGEVTLYDIQPEPANQV